MDIISSLIHEKIAKNTFNAAAIANGLRFDELPDDEARLARARLYRQWRKAGENVQAAFARAIRGEVAPSEFELHLVEEHDGHPKELVKEYEFFGRNIKVTDMQNGKFVYETDRDESGYTTAPNMEQAEHNIEEMIMRHYEKRAEEGDEIAESLGEA